ncbi:MAG: hypothetical protein AB8G86_01580, partial [Saprospiraceae bacterium]
MKSKNIFIGVVVFGMTMLTFWGIHRIYTFMTAFDSIEAIEVEKDETVKRDKEAYTEEELFTQRLSNPRAGDIYLIKEAIDSFSFFQIGNVDRNNFMENYPIKIVKNGSNYSNNYSPQKEKFALTIKHGDRIILCRFEEITYLEATDKYVTIHTIGGQKHLS